MLGIEAAGLDDAVVNLAEDVRVLQRTEATAGTWIFPNIQASHTPDSTTFNIHPLVYSTSAKTHRHFVFAPLYWDFEDYEDDSRATVAFPLFWRFRSGSTVSQLAGNTYYHHYRDEEPHSTPCSHRHCSLRTR